MAITISKSVWIEVAHRFAGHPIEANNRVHGHSLLVTVTAERMDDASQAYPFTQRYGDGLRLF